LSSFISDCGFPAIRYPESLRTLRLARNFFVCKCSVLQ
jgi:hypothetical protein